MSRYSKYKMFFYKEKILSLPQAKEIVAPLHIRIKPTNVCNHDCWYCSYRLSNVQLGKDMVERDFIPEEKMMEIIQDCEDMGVKAITFSGGGEPLVYKYMPQTLRRLADSPISFATLTNGSRLQGEVAELFAKYGTWVRVSMDGYDNESYQRFRSTGKEEFDKILSNMKKFKQLEGSCDLGVSYVVGKDNCHKVYEIANILADIGVDSLKIAPAIVDNDGEISNQYHQPFYELVREQIEKIKSDFGKKMEIYDSYHYQLGSFEKKYNWCPYAQILTIIGADLNVYPCHDKAYNLDNGLLGSIKDTSFKEWWLSNAKRMIAKINPSCDCNHHCTANEHNRILLDYLDALDEERHLPFI